MEKYKNKDGIELNFGNMSEEGRDGSGVTLIQEVIGEAVKICSDYNYWDETSMRFALSNVKTFLETNFDMKDKNNE
tara:strand:- start:235 stop:462 length:228 start_codon:yes stop_codon:yes gene_type:complete